MPGTPVSPGFWMPEPSLSTQTKSPIALFGSVTRLTATPTLAGSAGSSCRPSLSVAVKAKLFHAYSVSGASNGVTIGQVRVNDSPEAMAPARWTRNQVAVPGAGNVALQTAFVLQPVLSTSTLSTQGLGSVVYSITTVGSLLTIGSLSDGIQVLPRWASWVRT